MMRSVRHCEEELDAPAYIDSNLSISIKSSTNYLAYIVPAEIRRIFQIVPGRDSFSVAVC